MTYSYKSGTMTDKITISTWVNVTQAELDAAFADGSFSWGQVWSYRDSISGREFSLGDGWTVVGTEPTDYYPGPGQEDASS